MIIKGKQEKGQTLQKFTKGNYSKSKQIKAEKTNPHKTRNKQIKKARNKQNKNSPKRVFLAHLYDHTMPPPNGLEIKIITAEKL